MRMAWVKTVVRKGFDIRIHTKHSEFGIFYEFDIVIRGGDGQLCGGPWRYNDACFDTIEELMPVALARGRSHALDC
jgi:hypothetical protein